MEVCRKCKEVIKEDQKFIDVLSSWTLGFNGRGKYHLECWNKSKKNGIVVAIGFAIFIIIFIVIITVVISKMNSF